MSKNIEKTQQEIQHIKQQKKKPRAQIQNNGNTKNKLKTHNKTKRKNITKRKKQKHDSHTRKTNNKKKH